MIVALKNVVYGFNFPNEVKKIFSFVTGPNPLGLCEVSSLPSNDKQWLCFPAQKCGAVQLVVCNISIWPCLFILRLYDVKFVTTNCF